VLLDGVSVLAMKHVREAEIHIGDPVAVFGTDPWSLLLLQWARLQGASPLIFICRGPQPLIEFASSIAIDANLSDPTPSDLARVVRLTRRSGGFVVALDAIASEQSMTQALSILRDGGRYMLAGLDPQEYVYLNAYPDLHRRDLEIVSPMYSPIESDFASLFQFSLNLAHQGRLRLDGLIDPSSGWRSNATRSGEIVSSLRWSVEAESQAGPAAAAC
jgi:threonine dehydrogenase-like Zn-dependent dehydrogenase